MPILIPTSAFAESQQGTWPLAFSRVGHAHDQLKQAPAGEPIRTGPRSMRRANVFCALPLPPQRGQVGKVPMADKPPASPDQSSQCRPTEIDCPACAAASQSPPRHPLVPAHLQAAGMRPLLQTCRLCCHMTGIRCNHKKSVNYHGQRQLGALDCSIRRYPQFRGLLLACRQVIPSQGQRDWNLGSQCQNPSHR
jgi:hypothetical protein